MLTQESLDCYSGCEVGAPRLASLVLTSLCSVLWPDKQTYKETGKGGPLEQEGSLAVRLGSLLSSLWLVEGRGGTPTASPLPLLVFFVGRAGGANEI